MIEIPLHAEHNHTFLTDTFAGHESGLQFDGKQWLVAKPVAREETSAVLTVIAPALTFYQLTGVITALGDNVTTDQCKLHRLNGRFADTVVTCAVTVNESAELKAELEAIAERFRVDIAIQQQQPALAAGGLLVMDMDSTVIQIECIDEIAKLAGRGDEVSAVTAKAMRGELAFSESLINRVGCLQGVPVAQLAQIRDAIPLMPGIMTLINELKVHGWKIAIASGGFTYFADHLMQRLGLDAAFSNELDIAEGVLTGKVNGDIVDAAVKAQTVEALAAQWHIPMSQTIAMGDGANDLLMMDKAALGVACHAKPLVREKADTAIRFGGLHYLLYLLR